MICWVLCFVGNEEDFFVNHIKVCIADDNCEMVELLDQHISNECDMEVIGIAHSGVDCLHILKGIEPDVLILDSIMPHMDGLDVLEEIRANDKQTKVIILVTFEEEYVIKKAFELGVSYVILKPYDIKALISRIRKIAREEDSAIAHSTVKQSVVEKPKSLEINSSDQILDCLPLIKT